jgi:hypothetical protein
MAIQNSNIAHNKISAPSKIDPMHTFKSVYYLDEDLVFHNIYFYQ